MRGRKGWVRKNIEMSHEIFTAVKIATSLYIKNKQIAIV